MLFRSPKDANKAFSVHTRWIETEFDNKIAAYSGEQGDGDQTGTRAPITVEVNGRRVEVVLPADLAIKNAKATNPTKAPRKAGKKAAGNASGDAVTSPMQGTIVKVAVTEGQSINQGDLVVVLEAMKMEQPLTAHKSGKVKGLSAEIGSTVPSGTVLLEIVD